MFKINFRLLQKNCLSGILSKLNFTNRSINTIENINKIIYYNYQNKYKEKENTKIRIDKNYINFKNNFLNIQKKNFFNFTSNIDISVINERLNFDILLMIFDQCGLEPNSQGNSIRLRYCPLCDKPHNHDPTNLNTCCISSENKLFNCFRCGSKGHVIRILRNLEKKHNNEIIKDILNPNKFSSDSDDNFKRNNLNDFNKFNKNNNFFSDAEEISEGNSLNDLSDIDGNFNIENQLKKIPEQRYIVKDNNSLKNPFSSGYSINEESNEINKNNQIKKDIIEDKNKTKNFINNNYKINEENTNPKGNNNYNSYNNNKNIQHNQLNQNNINNMITSISGKNPDNEVSFKIAIDNIYIINELHKRIKLMETKKLALIKDYLIKDRKIKKEIYQFYKVGGSIEKFKNNDFNNIELPCISFPMFYCVADNPLLSIDEDKLKTEIYNYFNCDKFFLSRIKLRAIGKEFKHFMKIEPQGAILW
jgi:hypothetical protein